jgi:hypothetical protein
MTLITRKNNMEIWAQFDHTAKVYELFFDPEGESYTGWYVDSIKDAREAAKYILEDRESC